ncbi:MAG: gamma-glutamyl-gamma-aminobutyrate hydrolase family protein [Enterococcus sp.]
MKPIIGIAGNERMMTDFDTHWLSYTPKNFVDAIAQAGGVPLILPLGSSENVPIYVQQIDKLLLTGGQDIDPRNYHQLPHPKLEAIHPQRDQFELALIHEAIKQKKPILGICRGMQLLNVALGGTLYQDFSLRTPASLKHVQLPTPFAFATHEVQIEKETWLSSLIGSTYHVNSFHHQGIAQLAPMLTIMASASDGVIEAFEHQTQRISGIQWHPELALNRASEQKIFHFFVQEY